MGTGRSFTQEQKLIILRSATEIGVKEAAKVAEVHYTTVYDWRGRLESLGEEKFLAYRPSYPGRGEKRISEGQEKAVLEMWRRYPGFGPSQVRNQLRRQGKAMSTKTVRRIMAANGYKSPRKVAEKESCQRFEATRPLELVQIDILEYFINKAKVYLVLLLDDFSRFLIGWRLMSETSADVIVEIVQAATSRYGKMEEILTDRGFVFYSWRGINRFEKYLEVERIDHTHASAHHPKTLGKIEAANKQIQKELLRREHYQSVAEAEEAIGRWVEMYNYERTHQGLGGLLVPADRFHGRVSKVLESIRDQTDPEQRLVSSGVQRSVINVVLEPEGDLTLYVMGHGIKIPGGVHE